MKFEINFDVRALQDPNFAEKGIGRHTLYLLSALSKNPAINVVPIADPILGPLKHDLFPQFSAPPKWLDGITGHAYLNPSPLTHDTAPLIVARRKGLQTFAAVHDFIPFRMTSGKHEQTLYYQYLVDSLRRYDGLFPNSEYTRDEIQLFVSGYRGIVETVHCSSRFKATAETAPGSGHIRPGTIRELELMGRYVFVATADDPRKNSSVAMRAARALKSLGFITAFGGGLGEPTITKLEALYPDQSLLAKPVFLPRLTDSELRHVYVNCSVVIVPSLDEGFSLPVAEAIELGCAVVASRIPAHQEQIEDANLLFEPTNEDELVTAVKHALSIKSDVNDSIYRKFDFDAEVNTLQRALTATSSSATRSRQFSLTVVGPALDSPTGIAVYNKALISQFAAHQPSPSYVDLESLPISEFYIWLTNHQDANIIYIMGNNNNFHTRCFVALQNVPGCCVLHDSRLFEFLLNRYGPHYIVSLWQSRNRSEAVDVATVETWQKERRLLKDSFLAPLIHRCYGVVVHSIIAEAHIRESYHYDRAFCLPFALQMTAQEINEVLDFRSNNRVRGKRLRLAMLGETEATKGCVELIFSLAILRLQGIAVDLEFVGKSEGSYHNELTSAIESLCLTQSVSFAQYTPRASYLQTLSSADIIIQLRYKMFGQVSGPLADAVACDVPVVTTSDLAVGMGLSDHCAVIPNDFSPLHIAEAIRSILEDKSVPHGSHFNLMDEYASNLIELCGRLYP